MLAVPAEHRESVECIIECYLLQSCPVDIDDVEIEVSASFAVNIGRKDDQIKYMGYRIELGEIDTALQSIESVKDAAAIVVALPEQEDLFMIVFVESDESPEIDDIKEHLGRLLPKYMLPHQINVIDRLPRSASGKVDRTYLKTRFLQSRQKSSV